MKRLPVPAALATLLAFPAAPAALLALPSAPALAAPEGEDTPLDLDGAKATEAAASGGGFVRTIVGLAIVIGVIYGLYWVLRQVKASREERATGSGLVTIASLPLGPGRSLHLVRAGHEVLVVGASEHGVTPIRAYHESEARAAGLLDAEEPPVITVGPARAGALDALRAWTVRR